AANAVAQQQQNPKPAEKPDAEESAPTDEPAVEIPKFPHQTLVLGKPGFKEGYLIQAELTTRGGAVNWVQLTDPRYTTLDRREQLKVVGNNLNFNKPGVPRTFDMAIPQINKRLQ